MVKRWLIILGLAFAIALSLSAPAHARTGWTLIAHTAAHNTGSSVTVTTSAINDTGATLDVLLINALVNTTPPLNNLSDSASNTNYYVTPPALDSGSFGVIAFLLPHPITSASHTWTWSLTGSFPAMAVLAFSGTFAGSDFCSQGSAGSGLTVQPGSITPSSNGALLVTGYAQGDSSAAVTYTINAGFTIADQLAGGVVAGGIGSAYLIQGPAAAVNPTWTKSGISSVQSATMCSVLSSSGGGGETSAVFAGGS